MRRGQDLNNEKTQETFNFHLILCLHVHTRGMYDRLMPSHVVSSSALSFGFEKTHEIWKRGYYNNKVYKHYLTYYLLYRLITIVTHSGKEYLLAHKCASLGSI